MLTRDLAILDLLKAVYADLLALSHAVLRLHAVTANLLALGHPRGGTVSTIDTHLLALGNTCLSPLGMSGALGDALGANLLPFDMLRALAFDRGETLLLALHALRAFDFHRLTLRRAALLRLGTLTATAGAARFLNGLRVVVAMAAAWFRGGWRRDR